LPVGVAAVVAALVCAAVGVIEARVVLLPRALGRNELLTTVGAATIIGGVLSLIWGETDLSVESPVPGGYFSFLGGRLDPDQVFLICLAIVIAVGVGIWYHRTLAGLTALAVAEDRDAAKMRGINVGRKSYAAFAFGGLVAGAVGSAVGNQTYAYPELGSSLVLFAFTAFVLGGAGSLEGSVIGGMVIGLVQEFVARYVGVLYSNLIILGVLLAVLSALPNGLFGQSRMRTI
jgi:branched-chain amino acid transport system permease protein